MKKSIGKIIITALTMCLSAASICVVGAEGLYDGKTVILHTNDVHGCIAGYPYVDAIKSEYEEEGADVILVDAGDFSQDTPYVSVSKGLSAIEIMNEMEYDIAIPGNHEFDYGFDSLTENIKSAEFEFINCNIVDENGEYIYEDRAVISTDDISIAFIGVDTPETKTKANPKVVAGLEFISGDALAERVQTIIDDVEDEADIIICLSHLGVELGSAPNRAYDLYNAVEGLDFVIDGHSHTVMTQGDNGEPIQSTGSSLQNLGVIIIDNATKTIEDNYLIPLKNEDGDFIELDTDTEFTAFVQEYIDEVDAEYNKVFATSEVVLNGAKADLGNRDSETNNGDFVADAMRWYILDYLETTLEVDSAHTIAIANGGGIRAAINIGDVTKSNINTVLPFKNTLSVVYVSGKTLLDVLEASTFSTPDALGGFPQVSGISYTIDTTKAYDAEEEPYPDSTYYGPKSINRVTINEICGEKFDPEATYAVITSDFIVAGGDTYYEFASSENKFETGVSIDTVVMQYVETALGGVIGEEYAQPQGRITIITEEVDTQKQFRNDIIRYRAAYSMNGVGRFAG